VVKTLVMEDDRKRPLIVLMHGTARCRRRSSPGRSAQGAWRHAPGGRPPALGIHRRGISPFGTRHTMPVYMEGTILDLPKIYINGGRRGFLVGMNRGTSRDPADDPVRVAI